MEPSSRRRQPVPGAAATWLVAKRDRVDKKPGRMALKLPAVERKKGLEVLA